MSVKSAVPVAYKNKVLASLPPQSIANLCLRPVTMRPGREIEFPGNPIDHVFFLESGVALMTTTFQDGSQVEVGMFGRESVLGVSALMGTRRSLNRVYMLLAGSGYAAPMAAARAEFVECEDFQTLVLHSVQAQLAQLAQSAGCNARHDVEQRLARWMLLCADNADSDTLPLSQESVATMLGIRRMSAGFALNRLKNQGIISNHRGEICILDRHRLQAIACECYFVVKHHLDNVAEFDHGFTQPGS